MNSPRCVETVEVRHKEETRILIAKHYGERAKATKDMLQAAALRQ